MNVVRRIRTIWGEGRGPPERASLRRNQDETNRSAGEVVGDAGHGASRPHAGFYSVIVRFDGKLCVDTGPPAGLAVSTT